MDTLIVYASKYGATAECARRLAQEMGPDTRLCNLEEEAPALSRVDTVIVGGPIYAGMLRKPVKEFCKARQEALLTKRLGLFLCCTSKGQTDDLFAQNFPGPLVAHAAAKESLGGRLPSGKVKAMDRIIIALVSRGKREEALPELDGEAIRRFADTMVGNGERQRKREEAVPSRDLE